MAKDAAESETKSSVGDKYETGRAMSQNSQDLLTGQLRTLRKIEMALKTVDTDKKMSTAEVGALVACDDQVYFLVAALGPVLVEEDKIMVISPVSPIGQKLLGLHQGDNFEWQGKRRTVDMIK